MIYFVVGKMKVMFPQISDIVCAKKGKRKPLNFVASTVADLQHFEQFVKLHLHTFVHIPVFVTDKIPTNASFRKRSRDCNGLGQSGKHLNGILPHYSVYYNLLIYIYF
jgi:hypothetical protein